MASAREWIHHGAWTVPWHLRGTPGFLARHFRGTTTACGVTFRTPKALAVWSGGGPPPRLRCPVCEDADRVLQLMDERDA